MRKTRAPAPRWTNPYKDWGQIDAVLTTKEAAVLLKCHERTITNQINRGEIPAHKFGKGWLINKEVIKQMLGERCSTCKN